MRYLLILLIFTFPLFAEFEHPDQPPPIDVVRKQVCDAQAMFNEAKDMFNPWYSGPLLTGSSSMMPPGKANIQPYLFVTDFFGAYTSSGKTISAPDLIVINPVFLIQFGITDFLDMAWNFGGVYQNQANTWSGGVSDLSTSLGIRLIKQDPYIPGVKLLLSQKFPTGKWKNSDPENNALDMTGRGSYVTGFSLNISKVVWWVLDDPMNLRFTLAYDIYPTKVKVKGVNAYGGAANTNATIKPGRNLAVNFGYEYSFTKRVALALDLVYNYQGKTTFSGTAGTNSDGTTATLGGPINDTLQLAPAIEYNFSPKLGIVFGSQFSIWGRNSSQFAGGIFTIQWTFP